MGLITRKQRGDHALNERLIMANFPRAFVNILYVSLIIVATGCVDASYDELSTTTQAEASLPKACSTGLRSCIGPLIINDHQALARRFRPYYKFSTDTYSEAGREQEAYHPSSWEWFVGHSELWDKNGIVLYQFQLYEHPALLINPTGADTRSLPPEARDARFTLRQSDWIGEPWDNIINDGAGLYAQVEEAIDGYVVIVYWTLYERDQGTNWAAFNEHDGDITAVVVVYDRAQDSIVRAGFVMHGGIREIFDLQAPQSYRFDALTGVTPNGAPVSVEAKILRIADNRRVQDAHNWKYESWYSPSRPEVELVRDPDTGRFEHLATYIEFGTHEQWPNASGSLTIQPKHGGDGVSFLASRMRMLGSIGNPAPDAAPFLFFNGKWGDPPSPVFHRIAFDPKIIYDTTGVIRPTLGMPVDQKMSDRDPYDPDALPWPPLKLEGPTRVRMQISCIGNRNNAQVALRWGHPDFDKNAYFPSKQGVTLLGSTSEIDFDLPDRKSELEIQTEGGVGTGYQVLIWVDDGTGFTSQPSLQLIHNFRGIKDAHYVLNTVGAARSSRLNKYGEQNIRISTNGGPSGPIQ